MTQTNRQQTFGSASLSNFRARQIADLEHRAMHTMAAHASTFGVAGAPTPESELKETFDFLKEFAIRQVDKMKRMGVPDGQIREAVLGSIQRASLDLPQTHAMKPTFDGLLESTNKGLEEYIQRHVDKTQASRFAIG